MSRGKRLGVLKARGGNIEIVQWSDSRRITFERDDGGERDGFTAKEAIWLAQTLLVALDGRVPPTEAEEYQRGLRDGLAGGEGLP